MIKAIIFDCFGVLTADKWKEFVAKLPENKKEPARELNRALDAGILDHDDFYKQVHELSGITPDRVEDVINSEMAKNTELLDYISHLKKNYKIGLLSNVSSPWIRETFLNSAEIALFDDMIFSYEVGMIKPDSRIFDLAAERLGVETGEVIFIDDGLYNCEGAEGTGMKAILYHDFVQLQVDLERILHHM